MQFANLLLDLLRFDDTAQEYSFVEGASDAISALLDAIFVLPDPSPALDDLVKLSCALEHDLRSPEACIVLRSVLCSDARFLSAIGVVHGRPSGTVKRAPMIDAAPPPGSFKVRSLLQSRGG